MGTYQPITESLREMNQLLLSSRQWDAQQKQAETQWGLKEMQFKSEEQDRAQMRKIRQMQVAEAEEAMTPQTFNAMNFLTDSPTTRQMLFEVNGGAFGKELANVVSPGSKLNADGTFTGADGQPIKLNKLQFNRVAPALYSIATKYDDPKFELEHQIEDVNQQIIALDDKIGKISPKDVRFGPKRANLVAKRNALTAKATSYMDETKPEKLLPKLKENYKNLQQYAIAAATMGSNPQLNNIISNASAQLQKRIMNTENAILTEKLTLMKERRKDQRAGMGAKGELKLAFIRDASGNITDSKYIPVPKNVGLNASPQDLDPTLKEQNAVWAPQATAQEGQKKRLSAETKFRTDAVRRTFYDADNILMGGPAEGLKEKIAQTHLMDLEKSGKIKKMTDLEVIQESVKYPMFVLQKYQDAVDNEIIKWGAENDPEKITEIESYFADEWFKTYGFPVDEYRKLMTNEEEEGSWWSW